MKATLASIAGVPCIWKGEPMPFVVGAYVEMAVKSVDTVGTDETRLTYDDATQTNATQQVGWRQVVWSIDVHSYDIAIPASDYAELILSRFRRTSVATALYAIGLSVATWERVQEFIDNTDNRQATRAVLDITLNRAISDSSDNEPAVILQVNSGGPVPGTLT